MSTEATPPLLEEEEGAPEEAAAATVSAPESRRVSEWRRRFWGEVNRDAATGQPGVGLPLALSPAERAASWGLRDASEAEAAADAAAARASAEPPLPAPEAARLDAAAAAQWDAFYAHFRDGFFRDRHYLRREFPCAFAPGVAALLEVGCGAGNTALPLLAALAPTVRLHAFDFSARAVDVMRARQGFDGRRCHAFVCDVTVPGALAAHVAPASVDVALAVFALSAISPEKLPVAVAAVHAALRPGGALLVRDYAIGDTSMLRMVAKTGRRLREDAPFYVRGDGTRVLFFSKRYAEELFTAAGFEIEELRYDTRVLRNRKRDIQMQRCWLQAKLVKRLNV